jgi:hypothetical protein
MFKVTAGQHYSGAGNYIIWDQDATGITVNLKTPVALMFNYSKMDEGGSKVDDEKWTDPDDGTTKDTRDIDFYGVNAAYSTDAFTVNLIFATRQDQSDQDLDPWGAGIQANARVGPVALNAEIDKFGGTYGKDVDVVGTQAFLEGSMAMKDKGTFGLRFFYAMGTDKDDELQINGINSGGETFNPLG